MDRLADGSLAVIDYKTGANAEIRAWLDERPKLPQMPAYVQALGPEHVGAVAFARVRSGDTGYVGVARTAEPFPGLRCPAREYMLNETEKKHVAVVCVTQAHLYIFFFFCTCICGIVRPTMQ